MIIIHCLVVGETGVFGYYYHIETISFGVKRSEYFAIYISYYLCIETASFGGEWGEYFVIFGYYLYVEIVLFGGEEGNLYYIKSTSNAATTTTSTPHKIQ